MKGIPFSKEFYLLLPLFGCYIILSTVLHSPDNIGDEIRHLEYAQHLTQGYYTDTAQPEIGNGPGYPLILTPLIWAGASKIILVVLNAFLLFGGIVYFYKSLRCYLPKKAAYLTSYILGIYPGILKWVPFLYSESLAVFLACGFIYYITKSFQRNIIDRKTSYLAALFLGFLALTKVIFLYVILATLFFYTIFYVWKKSKETRLALLILSISLVIFAPFLLYTYSITGKFMYTGTQGGQILYWRTSPFPNEYGDWIGTDVVLGNDKGTFYKTQEIAENHNRFFKKVAPLPPMEQDSIFKAKAIENIKNHPLKYVRNTFASASRLFLNYPYSYNPQKMTSLVYIIPNTILLFLLGCSLFLSIGKIKEIPFEIVLTLVMAFVMIGGLILLDGRVRHLLPALPILLLYIVQTMYKRLQITAKT
ncbi:dolichyl-phosphate-mannose-protein mannosyltransferase [Flavobacteriaceae bacterium MAR_2009_75]|nr:dolichyl-phosphate-mannose-protein mannosyltransferase [Flavobacteriaceae bacterium MAR_2009_75]